MTIPYMQICEVNIRQVSQNNQTILCSVLINDKDFCIGIQNAAYPIPFGRYRAVHYKAEHPHTRLLLQNVPNHAGVEVHEANWYWQLKGCTAVGEGFEGGECINSVKALQSLITEVEKYHLCYVTLSRSADFQLV